jgi:hypothetical protein
VSFLGLNELALGYAAASRMVWISERTEESKIRILKALTEPAQGGFFTAWWRRPRRMQQFRELRRVLNELTE